MKLNEMFSELPFVSYTPSEPVVKPIVDTSFKFEENRWDKFLNYVDHLQNKPFVEEFEKKEHFNANSSKETTKVINDFDSLFNDFLNTHPEVNALLTPLDKDNIRKIVQMESSFNPKAVGKAKNSKSYGYFQINLQHFNKYNITNPLNFLSNTTKQIEVGCKHYILTKNELELLKKYEKSSLYSDFQLLYGLWFTGLNNMERFLTKGKITDDGTINLTQALKKAKKYEQS